MPRARKLSQEDVGLRSGNHGARKNILELSQEANGSNQGGNKSSFSDTLSNPDLDEIMFNSNKLPFQLKGAG